MTITTADPLTITVEQGEGGDAEPLRFTIEENDRVTTDESGPAYLLNSDQASAVLDAWKADSGHGTRGWTTNSPESVDWEFILASAFDDEISFASWQTYWSPSREGGFCTADFPFMLTITETHNQSTQQG